MKRLRTNHRIVGSLLLMGLLFTTTAPVQAQTQTQTQSVAASTQVEADRRVPAKTLSKMTAVKKATQPYNGWREIPYGNKTIRLYYKNGKTVTGFQKIGNATYYFALDSGEMQTGQKKIGQFWYFFDPKTGAMRTGLVNLSRADNPNGGAKTCFYDANGRLVYGQRKIGGYWYMFRFGSGAMVKNSLYTHDAKSNPNGGPKTCFYDANGRLIYGQRKIGNYWYMFRYGNGAMVQNAFYTHDSKSNPNGGAKTCYYDASGHMLYGKQVIGGKTYTFNTGSGALIGQSAAAKTTTASTNSKGLSEANWKVLINVVGAVESGGQIYGNRDYAAYAGRYAASPYEYTCTLGWAQFYGVEARNLINRIYKADPTAFKKIDKKGLIEKRLKQDWVTLKWDPSASEKQILIELITSPVGKRQQDLLFREQVEPFVKDCIKDWTSDPKAIIMYCEIRHQGGQSAANRIFRRCKGTYTTKNILAALRQDEYDKSSNYQVGDFPQRHRKCAEFVEKYTVKQ